MNLANRRDFFFAVIPYADSRFVFGVVPKACPQSFVDGLMERFSSDPGLLDLVESVMISINEWHLTASALAEMPPKNNKCFSATAHSSMSTDFMSNTI